MRTPEQLAALEAHDKWANSRSTFAEHARTIKEMLDAPRVPSLCDHPTIDAIAAKIGVKRGLVAMVIEALWPKPATKTVWRVQPEGWPAEDFGAIYTATSRAGHWLAQDIEVSIRKTEVPA